MVEGQPSPSIGGRLTSETDQALAFTVIRAYTGLHSEKRRIYRTRILFQRFVMPSPAALGEASWVFNGLIREALRMAYSVAREIAPRYTYSLFLHARVSPLHSLHAIAYPPDSVWMEGTDPRVWAGKLAGVERPGPGVKVSVGRDARVLLRVTRTVVASLRARGRRLPPALGAALEASGGSVSRALYLVYWASLLLALGDAVREGLVSPGVAGRLAGLAPEQSWAVIEDYTLPPPLEALRARRG